MTCRNEVGDILKSDLLEFATLDPRPVQQLEPTAEWNSDYLNEMNPLPAISKSVHQSNSIKLSSSSLSRSKFSQNKISPHTVLGKLYLHNCSLLDKTVIVILYKMWKSMNECTCIITESITITILKVAINYILNNTHIYFW